MELRKDNAVYNTENEVLINQLKKDGFKEVGKSVPVKKAEDNSGNEESESEGKVPSQEEEKEQEEKAKGKKKKETGKEGE